MGGWVSLQNSATRRALTLTATACALALGATVAPAQTRFSDFWGAWGLQSSSRNPNEWRMNCAQGQSVLVLTPDRMYTLGGSAVYRDYADCRILNGSGGAALLVHAHCSATGEGAENVMLEYDILSEEGPLRIQRRGQVGTEYRKCRVAAR